MTVIFPTGIIISYSQANYLRYGDKVFELYTCEPSKGGKWVASISNTSGCIIEAQPHASARTIPKLDIRTLTDNIRHYTDGNRANLALLKRKLQNYNAKSFRWRDE